jgi:hypothetical protein
MADTSLDDLGPVDYLVVEFPAPVAKTAVVAAAVTPGRPGCRRRI